MRYLAFLSLLILISACSNDGIDSSAPSDTSKKADSIATDTANTFHGILAAIQGFENQESLQLPLYFDLENDTPDTAVCIISHFYKNASFYLKTVVNDPVLPNKEDYFSFFNQNGRNSGLVIYAQIGSSFRILDKSIEGGVWLKSKDIPSQFQPYSWSLFFKQLDYSLQDAKASYQYTQLYVDTIELKSNQRLTQFNRGAISFVGQNYLLMNIQARKIDRFGRYLNEWEKVKDTAWFRIQDIPGRPEIDMIHKPRSYTHQNLGIGILHGEWDAFNKSLRQNQLSTLDSIPLFGNDKTKPIGWVPCPDGHIPSFYSSYIIGKDTIYKLRWTEDLQLWQGLTSMQGMIVHEQKRNYLRIIKTAYLNQQIWICMDDLPYEFKFLKWSKYFKKYPKGNEGWGHGYSWTGENGFLYSAPNTNSEKILEFPMPVEIYIKKVQGDWAKVHVKEVHQNYGEIYFQGSRYFNEWDGWLQMTDVAGFPNLEEIILGC